jgi:hypothetical protein
VRLTIHCLQTSTTAGFNLPKESKNSALVFALVLVALEVLLVAFADSVLFVTDSVLLVPLGKTVELVEVLFEDDEVLVSELGGVTVLFVSVLLETEVEFVSVLLGVTVLFVEVTLEDDEEFVSVLGTAAGSSSC